MLIFFLPFDLVPDFLIGPGQADDFGLFYLAYKKWRERKQHNSGGNRIREPELHDYPPYDEPPMSSGRRDSRSGRPALQYLEQRPQNDDEPGFFGRVWKAITYLFMGGDTL